MTTDRPHLPPQFTFHGVEYRYVPGLKATGCEGRTAYGVSLDGTSFVSSLRTGHQDMPWKLLVGNFNKTRDRKAQHVIKMSKLDGNIWQEDAVECAWYTGQDVPFRRCISRRRPEHLGQPRRHRRALDAERRAM